MTSYVVITTEIQRRILANQFRDGHWVAQYAVSFANLYRTALLHFERGESDLVPKAWSISFDRSSRGESLVIQDLILGINAHINHDLPVALCQVGIDPDRSRCHADHEAVNQALSTAFQPVRARVEELYAPGSSLFDHLLGPLEEKLTSFSFDKARENAWVQGVALVNAASAAERLATEKAIDERAAVMGQLIIAPTEQNRDLLEILRRVEQFRPWTASMNLPELLRTLPRTNGRSFES